MYKKNIAIIGAIKSYNNLIAELLAEKLEMFYLDTDCYFEYELQKSCSELLNQYGWDFYLGAESVKITKLKYYDNTVIATSSSVMINRQNITDLKNFSYMVLLSSQHDREIIKQEQSLATKKEIINNIDFLLQNRDYYAVFEADIVVNFEEFNMENVVLNILKQLKILVNN